MHNRIKKTPYSLSDKEWDNIPLPKVQHLLSFQMLMVCDGQTATNQ